ncbi:MAG: thermonuclease family protein [Candidatus Latescibacteria bacterium]|nr:thermonuclease family protein [Candidatus Latescibacterota bacterium]
MKTSTKAVAAIVLILFLAGLADSSPAISATSPQTPIKNFSGMEAYKVVRVVDGDTVILLIHGEKTSVRLIGVDTPETVHPRKPVQYYGREAGLFLKNLLRGEEVYIEQRGKADEFDRYGRLLAYLYRAPDGLFVNLEIVRQGYGHAYTRFPFQYMDLFRFYERKARECEKGLWASDTGEGRAAPTAPPDAIKETPTAPPDVVEEIESPKKDQDEVIVYITKKGKKYHREGCGSLSKSKEALSLEEAKKRGYTPCKICKPPR